MANTWFRMYAEFLTDPKVQMLSESDQRRYIMLLCLRCCNGDVTLHDSEVAFQLRISGEEWGKTKAVLTAKRLISGDSKPIAWDRRQYVSDSSTARVYKHRKNMKRPCNVTVTATDSDTDTDNNTAFHKKAVGREVGKAVESGNVIEIEKYVSKKGKTLSGKTLSQFLLFWKTFSYPKGKAEAADSWAAIKGMSDELFNQILAGAKLESENRTKLIASGKTPKWAQGWLSGRRWEDGQTKIVEKREYLDF